MNMMNMKKPLLLVVLMILPLAVTAGQPTMYFEEIIPGSAAEDAGFLAGDGLLQIDGREIESPDDLSAAVVLDNIDDQGTNGQSVLLWPAASYRSRPLRPP